MFFGGFCKGFRKELGLGCFLFLFSYTMHLFAFIQARLVYLLSHLRGVITE